MAGRKQFDVDTAVEQAMQVFWLRGYADASLDALGSATGLGRGSFYGAFGSKDALFRKCLDRYSTFYGAQYERALSAYPGEPARLVEAFLAVTLRRIADPAVPAGCLIAQSLAQLPMLPPDSRAHVRELLDAQRERVRAAFTGLDAESNVLDDLATYVVAVNQSLAVLSRADVPDVELRSVAALAARTAGRGAG
ncbi:transcriptional regulator, TetR family [Actinacidiphila alni]|uniref:Transcriptional regulator, TetR family n=1 Tax=Actinacidiphila alni TaxID=380248 RepID=A0A1I2MZZ3_9ACTN|nr:TetR/AcrR family transcriptional regulator [Actinacidiphila alni]SFF94691.1 transcriptional regulator, TetR family [Actinacidiphila alni]